VRVVSVYAPNGRALDTPFYHAKLAWYARLARWLEQAATPADLLVLGGDYNVAPADEDVWDPAACHGGTHVSAPERAAFGRLCAWGLRDGYRLHHREPGRFTWWDYRAGTFHKNFGMRIDHLLVSAPVARRVGAAEIDREARKGKPVPSDHTPLVVDLDEPGHPFDPGWADAEGRIARRPALSPGRARRRRSSRARLR
jgi:exodeoxyribonuclease-3